MRGEIKALFFDMDGVIIDSNPLWNHILDSTIGKYALDTECLEQNDDGFNLSTEEAIAAILRSSGRYTEALYAEILEYMDNLYARNFESKTCLLDGIPEVLRWAKDSRVRLTLVSNSSRVQVGRILNHYNLSRYFDTIITSDDVNAGKPDKEPYVKALRVAGVLPNEALVVEDSATGITAARNADIECIVVGGDALPHEALLNYLNNL